MPDISLEEVAQFFQNTAPEQVARVFDQLQQKSTNFARVFGGTMEMTTTGMKNLAVQGQESAKKLQDALDNISLDDLKGQLAEGVGKVLGFAKTHEEAVALAGQIGLIGAKLKFLPESQVFSKLGESARGSTDDIAAVHGTINKFFEAFKVSPDSVIGKALGLGIAFSKAGQEAKLAEAGIFAMSAASGDMGALLTRVGTDVALLHQETERFSKMTYEVGKSSGLSAGQVTEYARALSVIPGALEQSIPNYDKAGSNILLLDAAMKVASGTGMGHKEVFDQLNSVYREYGTEGEKALQYISRLSTASQDLKMPLDLVKEYTSNAARSFKFLGDNSQGVISILGRFGPALKESGMGPAAIADLVGNVTKNIAQMTTAQKAFLSGQTGGSRDLKGAYQIDLLMKEGKVDDVYKKVEDSLRKQFGGRIVTLEEAARDNQAAGQFTKQIQLLTSGPTKIAGSEDEAKRILDAFAKGTSPGQPIRGPEEAMQDAMKTGNSLQKRQTDILVDLHREAERASALASISAYNLTRLVTGTEGPTQKYLADARLGGEQIAASMGIIKPNEPVKKGQEVGDIVNDTVDQFENKLNAMKGYIADAGQEALRMSQEKAQQVLGYEASGPGPRVQKAITEATAGNVQESRVGPGGKQESAQNINVMTAVCNNCMKDIASEVAEEAANKAVNASRSQAAMGIHTGKY